MAKKTVSIVDREAEGLQEAKELIEKRIPSELKAPYLFKLKYGEYHIMIPKKVITTKSGIKVPLRYAEEFNSPFTAEQVSDGFEPKVEHIFIGRNFTAKNRALAEYLVLTPEYGKRFELVDVAGAAKREMDEFDQKDNVWFAVSQLPIEKMKSLLLLATKENIMLINNKKDWEIKLALRNLTNANYKRMNELMSDPLIETYFLSSMGFALGELRFKNGMILWVESNKEICKVPESSDPTMFLAKTLLDDSRKAIVEQLTEKIHG